MLSFLLTSLLALPFATTGEVDDALFVPARPALVSDLNQALAEQQCAYEGRKDGRGIGGEEERTRGGEGEGGKVFLKKSDLVQEIAGILRAQPGFIPSPDTATMQFTDLQPSAPYYADAQLLRAQGILLAPGGSFGRGDVLDPVVSQTELADMLARAFATGACDLSPNPDRDGDGIPNQADQCPDVPLFVGQTDSANGCPQVRFAPFFEAKDGIGIELRLAPGTPYTHYDQTEIAVGDRVKAVIRSPRTGEVMAESAVWEVRY